MINIVLIKYLERMNYKVTATGDNTQFRMRDENPLQKLRR